MRTNMEQEHEQLIRQEIEKIQNSMKDIQQMFFDLALLVDEQGEMLDFIQINVRFEINEIDD